MLSTRRTLLALALAACLLAALVSCGEDDDDTGDDAGDDDDDTSGDDDDDDTSPGELAPLTDLSWMLLCADEQQAQEHIEAAPAYGVDRIVLSHGLIEDIDEILIDDELAARTDRLGRLIHEMGLATHVWVHELSGVLDNPITCFDPDDPYWVERKSVYRDALSRVPVIDGVNITMGSGSPAPWFAYCFCNYCRELPDIGNPVWDALNSHPDERIRLVVNKIAEVVTDEKDREVVVHTFHHQRDEAPWFRLAMEGDSRRDYRALIKFGNHDWQPYYPPNTLLGHVGDRDQVISFDIGGEYWGQSVLPFCEVAHLRWRIHDAIGRGVTGANARIERGCNRALGTPNEVNLHALTRFAYEPTADVDDVWAEWIETRYGIAPASEESHALQTILQNTFDVGRKMYYVLGHWVFTKSSNFPDVARRAERLLDYRNAKWDEDWNELFTRLLNPDEQTVNEIWQEKSEAVAMADANLAALPALRAALSADDYADLERRLSHQLAATRAWRLAADLIFRRQLAARSGDEAQAAIVEGGARTLFALADEIEAQLGENIWPGRPQNIREFLADLREVFPEQEDAADVDQMLLSDVRVTDVGAETAVIAWSATEPVTGQVEYGESLPLYGSASAAVTDLATTHEIRVENLDPDTYYFFRVISENASGARLPSGDYRFWTKPEER